MLHVIDHVIVLDDVRAARSSPLDQLDCRFKLLDGQFTHVRDFAIEALKLGVVALDDVVFFGVHVLVRVGFIGDWKIECRFRSAMGMGRPVIPRRQFDSAQPNRPVM